MIWSATFSPPLQGFEGFVFSAPLGWGPWMPCHRPLAHELQSGMRLYQGPLAKTLEKAGGLLVWPSLGHAWARQVASLARSGAADELHHPTRARTISAACPLAQQAPDFPELLLPWSWEKAARRPP